MSVADITLLIFGWIILNLVLAIIPLILSIVLRFLFGFPATWIEILKEGELFLFSTTISANSIGKLVLPTPSEANAVGKISLVLPQLSTDKAFTLIGLFLTLLCSAMIFGAFSLVKFSRNSNTFAVTDRNYAVAALSCATMAFVLSYAAFNQGGMK
jgi:hypothetical protein